MSGNGFPSEVLLFLRQSYTPEVHTFGICILAIGGTSGHPRHARGMTGLENVGVRSKRKERKHYDEHQDTRCVWEAFGTPSRSPSPTASRPCSPMAGAAGRVLNAGFYELHEGGRRAHGSYAHKDRQVPALGTQVWQCIVQARSVSPQDARGAGGCDLSTEYGFKRLGKPKVPPSAGQQSSILLQWSELQSAVSDLRVVPSGKSHVGHFGQDSQQTLDCLQMKRCEGYTKSPRSATSPVPDGSRSFQNRSELLAAVQGWSFKAERARLTSTYGHVSSWDVSKVTSMRGLFEEEWWFNEDIRAWNTSAVTDMSSMFSGAKAFNQPIAAWDTSAVTDMGCKGLQPANRCLGHLCSD
eukprot:s1084_g26.t1